MEGANTELVRTKIAMKICGNLIQNFFILLIWLLLAALHRNLRKDRVRFRIAAYTPGGGRSLVTG